MSINLFAICNQSCCLPICVCLLVCIINVWHDSHTTICFRLIFYNKPKRLQKLQKQIGKMVSIDRHHNHIDMTNQRSEISEIR